jgi:8-amino-7-oxononanoate synthase
MRLVSGPQGPRVVLDGEPVLLLCSNNYLGLADHPAVREAAAGAAMRWGVGAGASRLVSGNMTVHRRLEERLAEFKGTEACVLFGSGYLANLGVISALQSRPGGVVFSDQLNHASIVDGCRLSRAEIFVYDHHDMEHLEWGLRTVERRPELIVTDGVFSMDGDVAPLAEIVELAARYGVRVMVDEAHATGAIGPGGRGAVAAAGLEGEVDLVVGTLGKALGSYGAFVCCDAAMARFLVNTARSLIFSTALPPAAAAGALAALELLAEQPRRVAKLQANARLLRGALAREGFDVANSSTQIVPLVVGDAARAVAVCEAALEHGVFAQAIRPPTVPDGTSRLRLSVMASHAKSELRDAARVLAHAAVGAGFQPAAGTAPAAVHVDAAGGMSVEEHSPSGVHGPAGGAGVTSRAPFGFEPAVDRDEGSPRPTFDFECAGDGDEWGRMSFDFRAPGRRGAEAPRATFALEAPARTGGGSKPAPFDFKAIDSLPFDGEAPARRAA